MIFAGTNNIKHIGGNTGNQVMRIMALMGFSKRYKVPWAIPPWEQAQYFENDIPQRESIPIHKKIVERVFHYDIEYYDSLNWKYNIDLQGYFQSPKYWGEKLKFKESYLSGFRDKECFKKPTIAISIRRGDFVNHRQYFQIPLEYYFGALYNHFPDWEQRNILLFSDDMPYCREFFKISDNFFFIDDSPIAQLAQMTLCNDFIISNSTFSYCGAYLSGHGKVIRPIRNFSREYGLTNSEKDFWVPEWIPFDPQIIKDVV